jgi:hypothetical protein
MNIESQRAFLSVVLDIFRKDRTTLSIYSGELHKQIANSGIDMSQEEMNARLERLSALRVIRIANFIDSDAVKRHGARQITLNMPDLLDSR